MINIKNFKVITFRYSLVGLDTQGNVIEEDFTFNERQGRRTLSKEFLEKHGSKPSIKEWHITTEYKFNLDTQESEQVNRIEKELLK